MAQSKAKRRRRAVRHVKLALDLAQAKLRDKEMQIIVQKAKESANT